MSALDSQAGKKGCTQYFCKPSTKFDLFSYAIWIVCSSKIKTKLGWLNPNSHNVHDLALKQWLNIIFRKHFNYSDGFAASWHITYKTYNFCFWKTKSNCHWEKLKEKKKTRLRLHIIYTIGSYQFCRFVFIRLSRNVKRWKKVQCRKSSKNWDVDEKDDAKRSNVRKKRNKWNTKNQMKMHLALANI